MRVVVRRKHFIKFVLIIIAIILFNILLCYVTRLPRSKNYIPPHRMFRFSPICEQKDAESRKTLEEATGDLKSGK